jgi:flagellar hook protein FlgE
MSLFSTLGTGASGMSASSSTLGVIGDNIANIGTTGFKSSRAFYVDMMPGKMGSASGPATLGRGAMLGGISSSFEQGALTQTGGVLDMAVVGNGLFPVSQGGETMYTRDGSFQLDREGYVTNLSGARLQGYQAEDGVLSSNFGELQLDTGPYPQQATSTVSMSATLTADPDITTSPIAAGVFDGTAAAMGLTELSDDSLGMPHEVNVVFEATSSTDWTWKAVVDGGQIDLDGDGAPDGEPGQAFEISGGTMNFSGTGEMVGFTQTDTTSAWNWGGAEPFTFTFDGGLDAAGNPTDAGSIRVSGDQSSLTSLSQDGFPQGNLVDLAVQPDGRIEAIYDNGQNRAVGGVALATFAATNQLERAGGNMYRATFQSGEALVGTAEQGANGSLVSRVLEASNTDLESEFIAMIQAQRSFSANAGTVRTADETLQELVNLI